MDMDSILQYGIHIHTLDAILLYRIHIHTIDSIIATWNP